MNFSLNSNKVNFVFVLNIFIEIKSIRFTLVKIILAVLIFFFLNYIRYVYFSVGLSIHYGYVFIYAFIIVLLL